MFVEYARNAARMAALMKARQIMVYTHDSIGLGEDGPTHRAVEQLASLRLTPNFSTRACDRWRPPSRQAAIARQGGPTALILSRQNRRRCRVPRNRCRISPGVATCLRMPAAS